MAEFFNVLNHTEWQPPTSTFRRPNQFDVVGPDYLDLQSAHRPARAQACILMWSRRRFLAGVGAASLVSRLQAQGASADLVLYNGKIVTVDDAFSIRQAIAIKDGRILAVGGNELRNQYSAARTIDLRGRMVMPGFHDTHIHLGGHSRRYIDLNDTKSLAELKQQVQ